MRHLHSKILWSLSLLAAAFFVSSLLLQQQVLLPSFLDLERRHAEADLARATEALANEVSQLSAFVGDWSGWDDTLRFAQDGNEEYRKSNLENDVFRPDSFDFLCILRLDGTEVWRGGLAAGNAAGFPEVGQAPWPATHPLLRPKAVDDVATGLVHTSHGPLLLASRPITDSARTAPPVGWIVMGRLLAPRAGELADRTRLDLSYLDARGALAAEDGMALAKLTHEAASVLLPRSDDELAGYAHVPALDGGLGLLVKVRIPRSILAEGRTTLGYASATTLLAVLVLFAATFWLMRRLVVRPLAELTRHTLRIRTSDDLSLRCATGRVDEIGVLAAEFDGLVAQVQALRQREVVEAREGGMAEVARAVLHDVGNALQGLRGAATGLRDRLEGRAFQDLERLGRLLEEHRADLAAWLHADPQGRKVPAFLPVLAGSLQAERTALRDLAGCLDAGMQHIEALLARQQAHTGHRGVPTLLAVADLFGEAERLARGDLTGGEELRLEVPAGLKVRVEKHRLLAVLVNLIRNARQAMAHLPAAERRLGLLTGLDGERLQLAVVDNGQGLTADQATRIFAGGYTTKGAGHGHGLHGAANSLAEIGGRVWAESPGPGRGATFRVEVPIEAALPQGGG